MTINLNRSLISVLVCVALIFTGVTEETSRSMLDDPPDPIGGSIRDDYLNQSGCPDYVDLGPTILEWPVTEYMVTQGFSLFAHPATDLALWYKQPIYSAGYGFVEYTGYQYGGYGWYVVINHGKGIETLYAHMAVEPSVDADEYVFPGKVIGLAGTTGHSTGVHLHFEISKDGCYKDPLDVFDIW